LDLLRSFRPKRQAINRWLSHIQHRPLKITDGGCNSWILIGNAGGIRATESTVSQIDELEARLDTLTTAILVPMRMSKHIDRPALDSLNNLVKDLISEVGDSAAIPRRLAGKLWFIFTQMLTEPLTRTVVTERHCRHAGQKAAERKARRRHASRFRLYSASYVAPDLRRIPGHWPRA